MVEQLYTNARTDTYKHPIRYVRAAVGIGRGARSGWVELGWRMGRSGATRPQIGGRGTWGQLLEQGGVRAADGSNWGGGWVSSEWRALSSWTGVRGGSCWNREGCAQRMGRIGVADGSERSNAPSLRGREHLYSAR